MFQEEISAVFLDSGPSRGRSDLPAREELSRPRTPARPPPLDGQASPSKIRKVYSRRKTEPSPPRRQVSTPPSHPRRRVPFIKKPRRVSAPAFPQAHNGAASPAAPWTPRQDPHLQEWSKGLLKDFHSLVEEEIRALHSLTPPRRPAAAPAPPPRFLNGLGSSAGRPAPESAPEPRAPEGDTPRRIEAERGDPRPIGAEGEPRRGDGRAAPSPLRRPTRVPSASMGGAQSTSRNELWAGERPGGAFRTYTLPRSGGHRSVSLSGAAPYRASAAHPDDSDVNCELLRVNPRFSRSHSLDESAGLSPWALHHLSVIDDIHAKPGHGRKGASPAPAPPTPSQSEGRRTPAGAAGSPRPEGHYAKIRRTGYSEKHNEQWRAALPAAHHANGGALSNGWPDSGSATPRLSLKSASDSATASSHTVSQSSLATVCANNGSVAFTPADMEGVSESWAWADQEDACSLTDRPCDSELCDHCQAKKGGDGDGVSVSVTPADATGEERLGVGVGGESRDDKARGLRADGVGSGRKSEPSLFCPSSPAGDAVDGGRRHTLPGPRLYGSLSLLSAPAPTFTTSSWETLPPADELEVELEEKPISSSLDERPLSPSSLSGASSRSLNSSLSSLSHLSVHRDHSECDSWPSSPVAHNLTPDVFLDPSNILGAARSEPASQAVSEPKAKDAHKLKESPASTHVAGASCTPSPEPITGMLQLSPAGAHNGNIIFSVSIPETRREKGVERSQRGAPMGGPGDADAKPGAATRHLKESATKVPRGPPTFSLPKERAEDDARRTTAKDCSDNNNSASTQDANHFSRSAKDDDHDHHTAKDTTRTTKSIMERSRSFSLDETSRAQGSSGRRKVNSASQSVSSAPWSAGICRFVSQSLSFYFYIFLIYFCLFITYLFIITLLTSPRVPNLGATGYFL